MVAILTNKSAYDASIEVFCVNPYIYTNSGGRTIGRRGGGDGGLRAMWLNSLRLFMSTIHGDPGLERAMCWRQSRSKARSS